MSSVHVLPQSLELGDGVLGRFLFFWPESSLNFLCVVSVRLVDEPARNLTCKTRPSTEHSPTGTQQKRCGTVPRKYSFAEFSAKKSHHASNEPPDSGSDRICRSGISASCHFELLVHWYTYCSVSVPMLYATKITLLLCFLMQ